MSTRSSSLLGFGLYFIDVLACLLFCITLALVGARFGREQSVALDLPRMQPLQGTGSALQGLPISLRSRGAELEIFLADQRVTLDELSARLRSAPPGKVILRSEESALARVIAVAHAAGVRDIELAYQAAREEEGP